MEATITIIEANRAHCAQQSLPVEFFNTVIIIPTFNRATSLARDHLSRASEVIPIRKRYIPTYKCGGARGRPVPIIKYHFYIHPPLVSM